MYQTPTNTILESPTDVDIENAFIAGDYSTGNCFPSNASIRLHDGTRRSMLELRVGDRVATIDTNTGLLIYSPIILFLDRSESINVDNYRLITLADRTSIRISADHLIYRCDDNSKSSIDESIVAFVDRFVAVRSRSIRIGDRLLVIDTNGRHLSSVVDVTIVSDSGAFAPLTSSGTMIVDDVVVSCYASIDNEHLAHAIMAPIRLFDAGRRLIFDATSISDVRQDGIHMYARCLILIAESIAQLFGIRF